MTTKDAGSEGGVTMNAAPSAVEVLGSDWCAGELADVACDSCRFGGDGGGAGGGIGALLGGNGGSEGLLNEKQASIATDSACTTPSVDMLMTISA